MFDCLLNNCLLTGNTAREAISGGGGALLSELHNCTVVGNWAVTYGGGVDWISIYNCIIYYNEVMKLEGTIGANHATLKYASNCCTVPLPEAPFFPPAGMISNEPCFVDFAGGNLRLQTNSPCINAGNNDYAGGRTDLDGNPRIAGGTVDIGAYEFQGVGAFVAWLQGYGLPTDGTAHFTDPDGDGFNNYQEYRCGTDPTNALSALRLLPPAPAGTNLTLAWPSATGRSYVLECSTNLGATPPFFPLATNLPGQPGATRFTVTNPAAWGPNFYRVFVP